MKSRFLKRLEKHPSSSAYNTYEFSQVSLKCGNTYHDGKKHSFVGERVEVLLLMFIMRALNIKLERLAPNEFSFEAPNHILQRMMFKLCRYTRSENHYKILTVMRKMIKAGVKPYNAIMLAHFIYPIPPKEYTNRMDIVYYYNFININTKGHSALPIGFNSYKEFINGRNNGVNYPINDYFRKNYNGDILQLIKLVKNGKYILAEKMILNIR